MPPDPLGELFLDENRDSPVLVSALAARGIVAHRFRDLFERGAPDEQWVPSVQVLRNGKRRATAES